MTRSTGMRKTKRKGKRTLSNRALRASGVESKDTVMAPLSRTGDLAIFVRAPGSDRFEPFDGKGIGKEPIRWPYFHRQHVLSIAESLRENNPGYEVDVRYMPDTAYEEFDRADYEDSYRPELKDVTFDSPRETKRIQGQTDIGSFRSRVAPRYRMERFGPLPEASEEGWDDPVWEPEWVSYVGYDTPYEEANAEEHYAMEIYAREHPDPLYAMPYDEDPVGYDPFDDPGYEPTMDRWEQSFMDDVPEVRAVPVAKADDLPGFVSAADYPKGKPKGKGRTKPKAREIATTPMETYATQTYGVNVVTKRVDGRLTPDRKANAIGESIVEMTEGRTRPLKDTIRKGVYYGVVETDAPEIGERRRMLVTGRVKDNGDRTYSVDLTQSDTGSPYMDVPRTYMSMLDPPVTEQDVEYRKRVDERFDGDGRPWDDRRYTVSGKQVTPKTAVAKLSKFTGRTTREVETDPAIRGMRVHDSIDMGSEGLLVRTFGRRKGR